ncbi:MAG: (2Fe-2S)-binding protein [Treponema sp.]|nr:(2Fe-2S)-binding protein [Treponema sp.]
MNIHFVMNGMDYSHDVEPSKRLIDMLREDFRLVSVREGCGTGECGACTVILNGDPVCSCLIAAVQVDGAEIITVDGLEQNGELDGLQKAFIEHDALQCGFCTPGVILTAKALLAKNPLPTEEEVKRGIAGNMCRCTGYVPIVRAILSYAATCNRQKAVYP